MFFLIADWEVKMIGYVTLGTHNLAENAKLYDAIAAEMGVGRMMDEDTFIAWGKPGGAAGVALTEPFDKQPAGTGRIRMAAPSPPQSSNVALWWGQPLGQSEEVVV